MDKRFICPKCRCGCLFEDKGKQVCLNCGAEVRKALAGVRHEHHYKTYTVRNSDRPVKIPQTAFVKAVQSATDRPRSSFALSPAIQRTGGTAGKPGVSQTRGKGCGFWILLFFGIFWLLPALLGVLLELL